MNETRYKVKKRKNGAVVEEKIFYYWSDAKDYCEENGIPLSSVMQIVDKKED